MTSLLASPYRIICYFSKLRLSRGRSERREQKGRVTWYRVVQDMGGEALHLQSQPNDAGRVGQHAMQNIEQGEEQCGCRLIVVLIVHIQA